MKVSETWVAPEWGRSGAQDAWSVLDISANRRVRGLGAKQRESLLLEFAKK
jgi:hypothetical protein